MPKFTDEQLLAINKNGTNIIVSAGAGSGKTAVLTERVIRILKSGVSINNILVLTFTKEAAGEMKDRIRSAIKKEGLLDELDYIDSSYITTFDSYALSIVRKYHYLLNLKKDVNIIDSSIIEIKKIELIDAIFNNMYGNESFDKFINTYTVKDDKNIKDLILNLSNKIDLIVDKIEYLNNYINEFYSNENINSLINEFNNLLIDKIKDLRRNVFYLSSITNEAFSENLISILTPLMDSTSYNSIVSNIDIKLPSLPRGSEEDAKTVKLEIKEIIDYLKNICIYKNEEELKNSYYNTKEYASIIIDIINALDEKLYNYKMENDSFEFIDIAKLAIKVIKENDDIRESLKKFYYEIMIDEYQDTNDLQESFIKLIMNNNVYVVGDIKQSIYRFRNANPNIFRDKYELYSNNTSGFKIDLLKNFRSRSEVLIDINKIFSRIMDNSIGDADYINTHQMVFGNTMYNESGNNKSDNHLKVLTYEKSSEYSKEEIEAFIIANDIKNKIDNKYKVMDKNTGVLKNIDYSDICIIMDRNTSFDLYKKIFEYMHIPLILYKDEKLTSEIDIYLIKNIINGVIKISNKEYDREFKYYMVSIMRSFLFRYNDEKIFKLIKSDNIFDDEVYKKLLSISKIINETSIDKIMDIIYDEFNIYENTLYKTDIDKSFLKYEYIKNLASSLSKNGYTIYEFSDYLSFLLDNELDIRYKVNTKGTNAVKIMNIHKSKGLEFPICYFSGFYKTFNKDDLNSLFTFDTDYGIILPNITETIDDTFVSELYKMKSIKESISEKIRLLYVALTRVREKMIIVCPSFENKDITSGIVSDSIRLKYNSFLMILESIYLTIESFIEEVCLNDIVISKDYIKNISVINEEKTDKKIVQKTNDIAYSLLTQNRYSKINKELISDEVKNTMDYGVLEHYKFECEDFYNPVSDEVKSLVSKLGNLNNTIIYKEYEFTINDGINERHGIIDLMIEYDDEIKIIDYKLSNISDEEYRSQLNGYESYIKTITNKKISKYLYSIKTQELKEL